MILLTFAVYAMVSASIDFRVGGAFDMPDEWMAEVVRSVAREEGKDYDDEEIARRARSIKLYGRAIMFFGWPIVIPMMLIGLWSKGELR